MQWSKGTARHHFLRGHYGWIKDAGPASDTQILQKLNPFHSAFSVKNISSACKRLEIAQTYNNYMILQDFYINILYFIQNRNKMNRYILNSKPTYNIYILNASMLLNYVFIQM